MASTVNFTGAVDRDLLKRAKIVAAKADTSINALFNAELRHLVETFEASEATGNQNFRTLLDFSLGRLAGDDAMRALGIDSAEDLFLLMAQALADAEVADAVTGDMVRTAEIAGRLSRSRWPRTLRCYPIFLNSPLLSRESCRFARASD